MPFDYEYSQFDYEIRPFEHIQTLRAIMKAISKRFSIKYQQNKEITSKVKRRIRTPCERDYNINAAP